tara:strand:+ start:370 stop:525 length:156 start_codon:yes stop_codon:yes gene_type:complete
LASGLTLTFGIMGNISLTYGFMAIPMNVTIITGTKLGSSLINADTNNMVTN